MEKRQLKPEEIKLIEKLLHDKPEAKKLLPQLRTVQVEELPDGGMGSLRFAGSNSPERRLGKEIAAQIGHDVDKVPITVSLRIDNFGDLYELDFWKVNFSPIRQLPEFK
ncbi:hypothetical protein I5M27_03615 [Adhaeribacter sp. BT258]|uniref:DUF6984 domain-containing protein n=1 Tax=Adhaeribacter terrigena TaxID=2793070 RepID=A0ABS1BY22_9BACT|nr:hypothetical protein [Adhaeribacter terrigena]MBK0402057.1 hypothetical protein [Adhaeribacter terrigena]